MKKITERVLTEAMARIESGEVTQKEVAESIGVSPSALNQRIKKIKSYAVPESFQNLTDKQKRFALAKVEGKNNLEAVKTAYNITSDESGKSMGTALMKDPDIKVAINDLMAQVGISKRYRIQRLKDMIDSPDLNIAGKGLDMSFKLTGDYAPEKIDFEARTISVHQEIMLIKEWQREQASLPQNEQAERIKQISEVIDLSNKPKD